MAKIQITISAQNAQAIAALQQVAGAAKQAGNSMKSAGNGSGFNNATKSAGGFLDKLSKVTIVGAGIIGALREIKDAAAVAFGPGYSFAKSMETNQLGMAGILQSMTLMDGKAVDFNQALAISSDMMKKLQMDALKTAASTEDLVEVFRAILSPGLNAGMTLEQIRQITTVGTNAIKSLGIPRQQIVQELRDLVQGGITAGGSTLATALGITDGDIKKAKNSSEGLFKFLMDRMQGFEDTAKRFPDTLAGKEDQLNEMWTLASAKFVEEFEEPIKDGLQAITDLIGTVNAETGKFEVNPEIMSVLGEIKVGYQEIKELINDVKQISHGMFDNAANSGKNLYGVVKDLGSILTDLARIAVKVSLPGMKLLGEELDREIERIKWLTGKATYLLDLLAKVAGAKEDTKPPASHIADFRKSEDTNTLPPVVSTNVTSKFPDANKAIENSQAALKIALDSISADAKKAVVELKREQESLEVLYKQSLISAEEYARRKAELEQQSQQTSVDEAQRKLEAIQGALYENDNEKKTAVEKANNELDFEIDKLKNFGIGLDDVNKAIAGMAGVGITWRKEVENVNIDSLQDNAKAAIDALGAYFYKLTGQQMVVSSGQRDWGGHVNGTKFDVVDSTSSELLEQNVNGIRDKIIAYARSIGLQVLDEYDNPSELATGGHLDINAKDFTATFANQAQNRIGQVLTKNGMEYLNAVLEMMKDADDIVKSLAETKGDVSSRQKAELTAKYNELIKIFQANGMTKAVESVQELQKAEFLKLDFAQVQKNLGLANGELVTTQANLMNELAAGTKSAKQVTDEYVTEYNAKTQDIVANLQRQLDSAVKSGNQDLAIKIRAAIREITDKFSEFFDAVIARIDAELQNEIAMINADRGMTSRQKQDKIDAVTRAAYAKKADEQEKQAQTLREQDQKKGKPNNATTIADLEKAAALNRKLAEIPSLLDKVHESSKQAFEDGLLTFLTDGITQCNTLGEAFRNLANTVLSAIQRVYAEALTKNIMAALGLGKPTTIRPTVNGVTVEGPLKSDGNFAEGGSLDSGLVEGPGTSTSDSILAWVDNVKKFIRVGNGEWIIRGAAVKKYGTAFLDRLNRGLVPTGMLPAFASGGSLSGSAFSSSNLPGPQDIATTMASGDTNVHLKTINVTDPNEVGRYLQSRNGEKVMVNWMKNNAGTVRQILNIRG
ncbi:hypothetical protein [Anaerospora sp.]|uniref:hypothetical protein n=1 Tax=Anaerospora sp. TaxID=1960278 RepID=UPI00289659FF|nr:hypothetical protein [Anaerospora sp.]